MIPVTKLDIAKMAVSLAVALKTTQLLEQQVADHTELDPDSIPVKVGCMVGGQLVAQKAKPYTDVATERTYNWIADKFSRKVKVQVVK